MSLELAPSNIRNAVRSEFNVIEFVTCCVTIYISPRDSSFHTRCSSCNAQRRNANMTAFECAVAQQAIWFNRYAESAGKAVTSERREYNPAPSIL
jgi:hypothetical protein